LLAPVCGPTARKDADRLLRHFGSLSATLLAPPAEIDRASGNDRSLRDHLVLIRQAMRWTLRQRIDDRVPITDHAALQDYLRFVQGSETSEQFRILYLDSGNRLIREEIAARGTVDEAPVYVRQVVVRALEVGAAGIILVHNHPSGIAEPSPGDKAITRQIVTAMRTVGMQVLEHLIVTRGGFFSFRAGGLL
jgi:DNA repair protein RadC